MLQYRDRVVPCSRPAWGGPSLEPTETRAEETDLHQGQALRENQALPASALAARSAAGGVLMGLANLVPGISGGTMLLAAGVYPSFISAIAEVTTGRFKARSLLVLGVIAGSAGLAILLLAGVMKTLVVEQRWIMYSLFIGLTLGGVPLVWRLARPATPGLGLGAVAAFAVMVLMSLGETASAEDEANTALLVLSGLAGASAMILPGISGGYLLLLLGQYEPILGAIDGLKDALLSGGFEVAALAGPAEILAPVGVGVLVGIVGVANLLRWLLDRMEKPTLGMLLGLLLGSVVGLYPFQGSEPAAGPSAGQAAAAIGLVGLGLAATLAVDRVGRGKDTGQEG